MKKIYFISFLLLYSSGLFSQVTTTSLKDPKEIKIFLSVTDKVRCICLPSLPIQACSFNMCSASAYLKTFIENQIKRGLTEESIIDGLKNGFGDSVNEDPIVKHFQDSGNSGMVDSIRYGFGDAIMAKPDATGINLTLSILAILGLFGIYYYIQKFQKQKSVGKESQSEKLDLADIQKKISDWEKKL